MNTCLVGLHGLLEHYIGWKERDHELDDEIMYIETENRHNTFKSAHGCQIVRTDTTKLPIITNLVVVLVFPLTPPWPLRKSCYQ